MYKKFAFLIIFLILTNLSFSGEGEFDVITGTTYYIDNIYGNNANSGKYPSAAWKTISKVNVVSFAPGDQILFKRGGIWYETLNIRTSGTTTSPIIYGAYGSGNLPVIDGSKSRSNCIYSYNKSNIIIRNLKLQNAIGSGQVRVNNGTNVRVENNEILVTGHGGVFIENTTNSVVARNSITTPSGSYNKQTDGIYSQRNSYNTYDGNNIVISNAYTANHIDGIQSYLDKSITIKNNFIFQNNYKTYNSQGIYTTTGSGVHTYFNNVVYCPNTTSSIVGFRNLSGGSGSLRLYHNTLIGKGGSVLYVTEDRNFIAKNNIFIATLYNAAIIKVNSLNSTANLNYNLYYNGGGTMAVVYNGVTKTLAQMRSLGIESKGVMANPKLEPNYSLKPGSGAINKGIDLGYTYRYDKAGKLRPQMSIADIGAYESNYLGKEGEGEQEVTTPQQYELSQNFPNPFNPSTQIRFTLPEASDVSLKIYDILGKEVATLVNETKAAGSYELKFDGSQFASGVYVYQLKTANFVQTKKMSLIK